MGFFAPTVHGSEYFQEIEETFVRRRGANLLLSAKDWALMNAWLEREIPLHIVIRAINDVFDVADKRPMTDRSHTISTLSYCKNEVEAQFAEWMTSRAGASPQADGDDGREPTYTLEKVVAHIDAAIERLQSVDRPEMQPAIDFAMLNLTGLTNLLTCGDLGDDWEAVDARLNAIEKELEAALLTSIPAAEMRSIENAIAKELAAYEGMDEASRQNTTSLMVLKKLRETSGIPRLGLFYL